MGTTAQKLEYLGTTKSQLKDMINYGLPTENQITNETTFRNYVKGIFEAFLESLRDSTTLYTNLPKISGNGTQITLNDTANAPMRITLNPSALSQDGTPTPDTPQDIHTISGDNTIVVEGKNLFDTNWLLDSNNYTNYSVYFSYYKLPDKFKTKFTATMSLKGTSQELVLGFTDAMNFYGITRLLDNGTLNTPKTYNFTNSSNVYLYIGNGSTLNVARDGALINDNYNIQIELGEQATTYEPYVSQTSPINLPVENLFDKDNIQWYRNNNSNFSNTTDTSTTRIRTTSFAIKGGETYTISGIPTGVTLLGVRTYETNSGDSTGDVTRTDNTFTLGANVNYIHLLFQGTDFTSATNTLMANANIMLEKGNVAHSYTPYGTTPIEYCKIGDYEDKFILTSGKNLFDKDVETKNAFPVTTVGNSLTFTNSTASISYVNCAYLEVGKTYKLSWEMTQTPASTSARNGCIVDNNNIILEQIQTFGNNTSPMTITPTHSGYLVLCTDKNTSNIMLNEGTTALPYEPYGTNQWYLKKNIGKVVLDGSESWGINPSWNYTNTNIYMLNTQPKTTNQVISDYFLYKSNTFAVDTDGLVGQVWGDTLSFRISNILANDIEAFKTWLSTHNTRLYYILNTPTYTQITGELANQLNNIYEKLLSYKGTTNVSQVNNDLPFVLGVSAIQDLE